MWLGDGTILLQNLRCRFLMQAHLVIDEVLESFSGIEILDTSTSMGQSNEHRVDVQSSDRKTPTSPLSFDGRAFGQVFVLSGELPQRIVSEEIGYFPMALGCDQKGFPIRCSLEPIGNI